MYEESVKSGIKELFFNAQGRFSCETFVVSYTALSLFVIVVSPLFYMLCEFLFPGFLSGLVILIYGVYLLYAHFAICIKRLHDLNLTGWLSFLTLLFPFSIFFIAYLALKKGISRSNNYGRPLNYTGPSVLLKVSYIFLALYALITCVLLYYFLAGVKTSVTGYKNISMSQKSFNKIKEEIKKSPRSMGVLFIDNQFAGAVAPIAKDRVLVIGVNFKKAILEGLSAGKKVRVRFMDKKSANITRLLVFNDSPKVQMSVFLIDPPIGVSVDMGEQNKKLLNEMNAFQ